MAQLRSRAKSGGIARSLLFLLGVLYMDSLWSGTGAGGLQAGVVPPGAPPLLYAGTGVVGGGLPARVRAAASCSAHPW